MVLSHPSSWLALARSGLQPRATAPKRVIVVGAGIAGLVAAYELLNAGHDPLILEAQQRPGGRICTLREPFSDGLYAEAGAMRIPRVHDLTMAYVERFGLRTLPFTVDNPNAYYFLHGRRWRISEANANIDALGFETAPSERGRTVGQLWDAALKPVRDQLETVSKAAWSEILATYDRFSTREFLERCGWSEGAIEMFGLLTNQEALMNSSCVELLREEVGNYYTDMVEIEAGMDNLPRAFMPKLKNRIRFAAKMVAVDQAPDRVTIHYQTGAGYASAIGDYAILTVPFPVLRHVEIVKPFSRGKQRAVRQLHYDASAKILLQCRRRFWEKDDGIFGGKTMTDLPIRAAHYPDHGQETGRGVLLGSYTWSEDAHRWGSLSPSDQIAQALRYLAQIHPQTVAEFEVGTSKIWHHDEFAGGAFALFDAGQQTLLHQHIVAPEGRIHFAGEHASLTHAWIQGAVESGLRAADEVHRRSFQESPQHGPSDPDRTIGSHRDESR